MFNNAKRPFYKSCKQLQFPKLGPDFTTWIIARFNQASVKADTASIDFLRAKVADTPNYVQEACFQLLSHGVKEVRVKDVEEILDIISTQASYSFESLLNTLTSIQVKFLRLFISEGRIDYSKNILAKHEIKNGSNLQAAAKALVEKQILTKDSGNEFSFDDPMFQIWLNKKLKIN